MNHRFWSSMYLLVTVIALVSLMTVSVAAQAPVSPGKAPATIKDSKDAKKWTGKTPDGQPDLQGYWTNSTYTPLQRPQGVTKEFYSGEEVARVEKQAAEREAEQTEPGTIADVHYDFTQFGLDRSQGRLALNLRTSMIVDPPDGRIPPMTADGQRRQAQRAEAAKRKGAPTDAVQNQSLSVRCILMDRDGPPMLPGAYNNTYQIVQAPGYVMILVEMLHDVRIVPLDGHTDLPAKVSQWQGSYRGRWEGETLVVESKNFNGKSGFPQNASENMRMTERFTRVDPDTIRYQFTVDDPSTWSKPWTAELLMKNTNGPIFEHACHEGNYGLANTLSGARVEEKRKAEAARPNK